MRGGAGTINPTGLSTQATLKQFRALCDEVGVLRVFRTRATSRPLIPSCKQQVAPIISDVVAKMHAVCPGIYDWDPVALDRLGKPLEDYLLFKIFTFADGNLTPVTEQHVDWKDSREVNHPPRWRADPL
jgi:hypothetical protein